MKPLILAAVLAIGACRASTVTAFALVESPFCSDQDGHTSFFQFAAAPASCSGARLIPQTTFSASAFAASFLSSTQSAYAAAADFRLDNGISGDSALVIGTASSNDPMTISVSGKLVLGYLVNGSTTFKPPPPNANLQNDVTFSISCNGALDQQDVSGGGYFIFNCPYVPNQKFSVIAALTVRTSLTSNGAPPFNELVDLDYSHTVRLASATLLDSNGLVIPNGVIIADSGFDYLGASAPEPATGYFLLGGALTIGSVALRRRRTR
jgi:hypothetical protein